MQNPVRRFVHQASHRSGKNFGCDERKNKFMVFPATREKFHKKNPAKKISPIPPGACLAPGPGRNPPHEGGFCQYTEVIFPPPSVHPSTGYLITHPPIRARCGPGLAIRRIDLRPGPQKTVLSGTSFPKKRD
jgi:hypothetical protein